MNHNSAKKGGMRRRDIHLLRRLARSCGISACFENCGGAVVQSPTATLTRLINALTGASLPENPRAWEMLSLQKDIIRQRRQPGAAPLLVAWGGRLRSIWFWLPRKPGRLSLVLKTEDGRPVLTVPVEVTAMHKRGKLWRVCASFPVRIPEGYWRLDTVLEDKVIGSSFLISAPRKAAEQDKGWGLFVPTYALQTTDSGGIGGFRELKEAAAEVKKCGGTFIGTLPLLATAYESDAPDPSPYAPQTRLFWNEIFLATDDAAPPERGGLVDYGLAYRRKRQSLNAEAGRFFAAGGDRSPDYIAFVESAPYLDAYARFRAAREGGREEAERFHRYVQFRCHRELSSFRKGSRRYAELYLDYPIGVRVDGFDAAHFGHLFLSGVQVGAPPDMFFSKGQNWGFQPFHPRRLAEDGFAYFRATLNNYFRYARMLRLDHIMGLYRLYCIPEGFGAQHGAYVRYPFDAFLAILCLEAKRNGGLLAGEDLGTVPGAVRRAMTRHGISRMWVAQLEMKASPRRTFRGVTSNMIASLNTHDLFPFAAYMEGKDIDELARLGLMTADEAAAHQQRRRKSLSHWQHGRRALQSALKGLAASPARRVIINVEDLWRETMPQNIPGTCTEYANWRRRLPFAANEWRRQKGIRDALRTLNRYRGGHGQR